MDGKELEQYVFQKRFDGIIAKAKAADLKGSGILTIRGLADLIVRTNSPQATVVVEFGGGLCNFGDLHSYRGYYSDLALDPYRDWSEGIATAASVVEELYDTVGNTFEGYKGGDYEMRLHTPVWVSGYGDASGIGVTGVRWSVKSEHVHDARMIVITTAECGS